MKSFKLLALLLAFGASSVGHADTFLIKFKTHEKSPYLQAKSPAADESLVLNGNALELKPSANHKVFTLTTPLQKPKYQQGHSRTSKRARLKAQLAYINKVKQQNPGKIEYMLPADLELTAYDSNTPSINHAKLIKNYKPINSYDSKSKPKGNLVQVYDFSTQWNMLNFTGVSATTAKNNLRPYQKNLAPVNVSIIDTGLAKNIPNDLKSKIAKQGGYFKIEPKDVNSPQSEFDLSFTPDYRDRGEFSHGTHVAGIVSNSSVNDNIQIQVVKALSDEGSGSLANLIPAIEWALGVHPQDLTLVNFKGKLPPVNSSPARILNLSLGFDMSWLEEDPDADEEYNRESAQMLSDLRMHFTYFFEDIAKTAKDSNALMVFAAGNSGGDVQYQLPQSCPDLGLVLVQSTGPEGNLSHFSTYGKVKGSTTISAPGGDYLYVPTYEELLAYYQTLKDPSPWEVEDLKHLIEDEEEARKEIAQIQEFFKLQSDPMRRVLSTIDRGYDYAQGTSMAAPHVAGVAALMVSLNPQLTSAQLSQKLFDSQGQSDYVCGAELHQNTGNTSVYFPALELGVVNETKAAACAMKN